MKNLLSKKKKLADIETIALTESCSDILTNKLPPKLKDLESFTIPCSIGNQYLGKALCNLGTSINLMPLSTFRKLGIGHVKSTMVTLQLTDRSLAQPGRQIKDVLVRMDKFIFLADFIILDYVTDKEQVTFSVFESVPCNNKEECHTIDVLDDLIEEEFNG
ncbi:uncharacterized protein LOC108477469 [Gossypium arboreum]|uniref:uncharacterized protein LOC108477469 n=1 Tax=Gossypium arboreum TaxID=29729 RepID=UPI0008191E61|nr:uncharacterized protein LOC108477469 [Gossypium arboreum]